MFPSSDLYVMLLNQGFSYTLLVEVTSVDGVGMQQHTIKSLNHNNKSIDLSLFHKSELSIQACSAITFFGEFTDKAFVLPKKIINGHVYWYANFKLNNTTRILSFSCDSKAPLSNFIDIIRKNAILSFENYQLKIKIDTINNEIKQLRLKALSQSGNFGNVKDKNSLLTHFLPTNDEIKNEYISNDSQFLSTSTYEKKVVDFNVQNKIENVPDLKASSTSKGIDSSILNEGTRDSETYQNLDEIVVQFRDYRGEVQSTPFSKLKRLGYILSEVAQLQSNALHFILEDNIEKPETGVPESWMVNQNGEEKQVFLLKKKKGVRKSKNSDYSGRMMEKSSSRKFQRQYFDNDFESESEMPKNFWMKLPTFKRYLRNEAELRLWILGPDWEELVRGESEWRLQLYKQWLRAVDNGIGEDAFDQLSSVPITRRRKRVNRSEINDMPRRRA